MSSTAFRMFLIWVVLGLAILIAEMTLPAAVDELTAIAHKPVPGTTVSSLGVFIDWARPYAMFGIRWGIPIAAVVLGVKFTVVALGRDAGRVR